jgi:hypothetical protein
LHGGSIGGRTKSKAPLRRLRRRWVDNINMDLREVGRGGMDSINLAENGDQWSLSCKHGNEISGSTNAGIFLSSCLAGGFARVTHLHELSLI